MIEIDELVYQVKHALELELAASAGGYPGANDDVTTYCQAEILESDLKHGRTQLLYHLVKLYQPLTSV